MFFFLSFWEVWEHEGSVEAHAVLTFYMATLYQLLFSLSPAVKGKRKADLTEESRTKKAKLVNDGMSNRVTAKFLHLVTCRVETSLLCDSGFCVFVGNLDKSKTFDEVKDTLATYFMTKSLLVQDIRLNRSKWVVPWSTLTTQYKPGRLVSASTWGGSPDLFIWLIALRKHNWLKGCVGYRRKHAHVNLASQLDLTKALTLNGEQLLDKTLKIEKAKVKTDVEPEVKTKKKKPKVKPLTKAERGKNTAPSPLSLRSSNFGSNFMTIVFLAEKNTRSLFLKNVPFKATKDDILKVFPEAVNISFPGRTKVPCKGWVSEELPHRARIIKMSFVWLRHARAFSLAFVEFKDEALVSSLLEGKQEVKMEDRVLIVASARESKTSKKNTKTKVKDENKKTKQKPAGTWNVTSINHHFIQGFMQCFFIGLSVFNASISPPLSSCSEAQQQVVCEQSVLCHVRKKPQEVVFHSC